MKTQTPTHLVESTFSDEDTITFRRKDFYAAISLLTFLAGIMVGYLIRGPIAAQAAPLSNTPVANQQETVRYEIPVDGAPFLGPKDAPITIVEYSDYQCPFCKKWNKETYKSLLAAYPGKIKFVYRNLPLTSIHPSALPAAEAALCAGDQNAYWQFHDKLFAGETLGDDIYTQYAQDLGLNMAVFQNCVTSHKYKDSIQKESDYIIGLGVRSTPTFFINGIAVVGAQPLDVFKQIIDKELARE